MWNTKPYQVVSEHHRSREDGGWNYTLCIRINGRRLIIRMSSSGFENSPARLEEASNRMDLFLDDDDDDEEDYEDDWNNTPMTDEEEKAREEKHQAYVEITRRFYDWAVAPFLSAFQSLVPPPTGITTLTMAHVYHEDSFECELRAVDDKLVPGAITKRESKGQDIDAWKDCDDDDNYDEFACPLPTSTTLPVFRFDQVQIRSVCWERTGDLQQIGEMEYSVDGRDLSFEWPPSLSASRNAHLVRMHEAVASANLGPEVRIQSLFGLVVDGAGHLFGLLAERIPRHLSLSYSEDGAKPVAVRERWMAQIEATVEALHRLGFLWGRPSPYSVAVDKNDEVWLVDFDPVPDEEFPDEDSPSRENDFKGIAKIRKGLRLGGSGLDGVAKL